MLIVEAKTKTCTRCNKELPATTEFYYEDGRGNRGGPRSTCKTCCKQYQQTERYKQYQKQYRQTHKVEAKDYQQEYFATINGYLRTVFSGMRRRCNNPGCKDYKNYGGRGIKVHFESVDNFIDYVVNTLQVDPRGLQIDRINNDGDYEPDNIRFVTAKVNNNNRRRNYGL